MYVIYADDICIYNDAFSLEDMKLISPKLVLEDNAAGTLTMTVPASNRGYSYIKRMATDIFVLKDGEEIWRGRVLSEAEDFYKNRVLSCEGEFAFFNDSTQPPKRYYSSSIREYVSSLLTVHNSKVADNRQFTVGMVTVIDDSLPTRYTNYEKTIEIFNSLIDEYGGHFRVRKENGVRYLDYLADYPDTCTQTIQFGTNLIEHTKSWDMSEFATVIVPLGNRLDNSDIAELDAYLTIESVNDGSLYIQSEEAVAAYGWIEKTVTWDDVSDASVLLEKAKTYLSDLQFDNMELEISAVDLHYLDTSVEAVKLLDEIRVISRPHGLDRMFPVTKLEIPLDSPESTQFKLGDTVKTSLTSANNKTSSAILNKIEKLPKAHQILQEAKDNATAIMTAATTGFVTITQDEYGAEAIYISNIRDYTKADKLWKWNMNGLGYSKDYGKTFGLAITMDGSIVADYITSGVLSANVIRAGVLQDYNENFSLDFDTGKLVMKKGSIDIGNGIFSVDESGNMTMTQGSINIGKGKFKVETSGKTYIGSDATFAGNLASAGGTFSGTVYAASYKDLDGNDMMSDYKFSADYLELKGITITDDSQKTTFKVDSSGDVTVSGVITMANGSSINWANITEINLASSEAYSKASSAYVTATAAETKASSAYEARCNDENVFNVLTSNGTKYGIFSDSSTSKLYINADYIKSGTLSADVLELTCSYGGFCKGQGMAANNTTSYGAMMYGANGKSSTPYLIVTNAGARIQGGSNCYLTVTASSITMSSEPSIASDLRIKNTVNYDLKVYEDFFFNLKAATFKYNNGTSGRTHFGFIAQDVENAIANSGLSSVDLAALIKEPVLEVLDDGIDDYRYSIRYGELIALNTYMIQKLYHKIDELIKNKGV